MLELCEPKVAEVIVILVTLSPFNFPWGFIRYEVYLVLPFRYWALAVPTYAMVTIVLAIGFYIGLNFMATPPPTSLNTIFGEP